MGKQSLTGSPMKVGNITQRHASIDMNTSKKSNQDFQTARASITVSAGKPKYLNTRICLVQDQLDEFFNECDIKEANKEQALYDEHARLHDAFQKDFSKK